MLRAADLHAAFAGPAAVVRPEGEVRFVGLPPAPLRHAPAFLQLQQDYQGGDKDADALRGRFDLRFPEALAEDERKNTKDKVPQARARGACSHRSSPHPPTRRARRRRSPRSRWGATALARSARTRRRRRITTRSG